jgi:hypothetical protein
MRFLHLPMLRAVLLAAHRVLQAADGILHFSLQLVAPAFGFGFLIARRLAASFLHFPLGLFGGTFDAILVDHCVAPQTRLI